MIASLSAGAGDLIASHTRLVVHLSMGWEEMPSFASSTRTRVPTLTSVCMMVADGAEGYPRHHMDSPSHFQDHSILCHPLRPLV